jgi:hypothetical protein
MLCGCPPGADVALHGTVKREMLRQAHYLNQVGHAFLRMASGVVIPGPALPEPTRWPRWLIERDIEV